MRTTFAIATLSILIACDGHNTEPQIDTITSNLLSIDLISPSTCQLLNGRLRQCAIPSVGSP